MRQIETWLVDGGAHILGELVGSEEYSPDIRTSHVVSREGSIVTTASGSQYELVGEPHPYMTNPDILRQWDNATGPFDAIDKMIERRKANVEA